MTKSKIFFILSLSFLGGVFAASFFQIDNYLILIFVLAGISIFIVNYRNKKAVVAGTAVLFLALGIWRTNSSLNTAKNNLADQRSGPVEFFGVVSKEPEVDEKYQKVIVEDDAKNKILINSDVYPSYKYGDQLKISCILEKPKNYENSSFDYQMYLAKDGIYRICNKANILILGSNTVNVFYNFILNIKNKFEENLSA